MEVLEEYFGLGLRHREPSIRVDGEPCDDDIQLRVIGKVVTVVTGRTEEIRKVAPAIISVLSLLRVWVANSIQWGPESWRYLTCRTRGLGTWAGFAEGGRGHSRRDCSVSA